MKEPRQGSLASGSEVHNKIYGYIESAGQISVKGQIYQSSQFIDSGATFNAVSEEFAKKTRMEIIEKGNLDIKLGLSNNHQLKKRLVTISLKLPGMETYQGEAFVFPTVPEGRDILLGMPWLQTTNPDINWQTGEIHPCVKIDPARKVGKRRHKNSIMRTMDHDQTMKYYSMNEYMSTGGPTRIVPSTKLKQLLKEKDNQFAIFIHNGNQDTAKVQRYKAQGWQALEKHAAYSTLIKYKDTVFREQLPNEVPREGTKRAQIEHEIDLTNNAPVHVKQFRLSPEQRKAITEWVKEMEQAGIIRKSNSPYSSPTFCVKKPIGWRIVHDFRMLNARTRIPQVPIPRKDEIFDRMHGCRLFSTMDLLHGFFQLRIRQSDIPYTAFSTPTGHFEYLVTPMGLSGSPGSFNRLVQSIFEDMHEFCSAYFDDVYIYTKSESTEEHLAALDRVLQRCEQEQLYVKLAKCVFCAPEIPCLGDFVGREGVRMDPEKVKIIQEWPEPKTKREMKKFLGTVVYNQRFCKRFGDLVAPLHEATKNKSTNEKLHLSYAARQAFQDLKQAMCSPPVLALPDFNEPFLVKTDASNFAVGGVLMQADRIVAYTGRKMSSAELSYPVQEQELLAVIHALRVWRPYLLDQPFELHTDHKSLELLLSQKKCNHRLIRWLHTLAEFSPRIKWIPGDDNEIADGLSRRPDFTEGGAAFVSLPQFLKNLLAQLTAETNDGVQQRDEARVSYYAQSVETLINHILRLYDADARFGPIRTFFQSHSLCLKEGKVPNEIPRKYRNYRYDEESKLLLWTVGATERICVPHDPDLFNRILYEQHDTPSKGHPGITKTMINVQRKFYWHKMDTTIYQYVQTCEKCQRHKARQSKPPGELHPHDIPKGRWRDISMDFIVNLPETKQGFTSIWVIVDRLSKRIHLFPIRDTTNTTELARLFVDRYQSQHGLPSSIVSDRDSRFTARLWEGIMQLQGTELKMSCGHRPQTDGQSERVNRFIEDYVRNYVNCRQTNWDQYLGLAEYAFNAREHSTHGMTPFEADIGYIPSSVLDIQLEQITSQKQFKKAKDFLLNQQRLLIVAQDKMAEAQERFKKYYDKNRPIQLFNVGDKVLIQTKDMEMKHIGVQGRRKFAARYIGPYPIVEKVSTSFDTYKVKLPPGIKIHPVFHTSSLKPYYHDASDDRNNIPQDSVLLPDGSEGFIVYDILEHRYQKQRLEYKVRWQGFSAEHDSWEPASELATVQNLIDAYHERTNTRVRSQRNRRS